MARLGVLERDILEAIEALPEGERAGAEIAAEIGRRYERKQSVPSTYSTLTRLEAKGLVSVETTEPTGVRGGRRKKVYHVTDKGRASLGSNVVAMPVRTAKLVTKVSVTRMEESKGTSYWVTITNSLNQSTTPYTSRILDQALMEADEWAAFFGVQMTPYFDESGAEIKPSMTLHNFDEDDERRETV